MNRPRQRFYEFDRFRFDTTNWQLLREGRPLALKSKALETLLLLIEKQGQVLGKEELMKALWPDSFVEEANLTQNIYMLRKALGDKGYIETVPRRGYRFTMPIRQWDEADSDLVIRERARVVIEEQEEVEESKTGIMPVTPALPMHTRARLRWRVLVASVILAVLGAAGYDLRARIRSSAAGPEVRSIAVLPFESLGADDDEYLGLGMADAVITRITHLRHISVRPTGDVRQYTAFKQDTARRAGQELRVDAVLEGTVQRFENNIRIRVQLVRVADNASIWADEFEEPVTNIFRLQDSIAAKVTQVLAMKLSDEEERSLAKTYTESAEAYQAYIKGRYFWNKRNDDGMAKAFADFQQAINLDPNYALAYVGLADCYLFGYPPTMPPKVLRANGKAMAKKALELDPNLGEAHATLGLFAQNLDRNWDQAETEYKRAIELNPNYPTAHHWYGEFLTLPGRFDESLAEMKIARELDPVSLIILKDSGEVYYAARKYDQAIEYFRKVLEMDPSFIPARRLLAMTYLQQRDFPGAIRELQTAIGQEAAPDTLAELGYVYALSGRKPEAERILRGLRHKSKLRYTSPRDYALIYAGLGDKDKAFECLENAFREGSVLLELKVDARWDPLRGDPRFTDLLKRAGMVS